MNNSMMAAPPEKQQDERQQWAWRPWAMVAAAAVAWWLLYNALEPLALWITTGLLGLPLTSALGSALAFFLYDVPKILLLLSGMIFLITTLRTFFSAERTRQLLGGKRTGIGNVRLPAWASSPPSVPARPCRSDWLCRRGAASVTFLLIAAPMVNEVAPGMLFGMFGRWR